MRSTISKIILDKYFKSPILELLKEYLQMSVNRGFGRYKKISSNVYEIWWKWLKRLRFLFSKMFSLEEEKNICIRWNERYAWSKNNIQLYSRPQLWLRFFYGLLFHVDYSLFTSVDCTWNIYTILSHANHCSSFYFLHSSLSPSRHTLV